ncbi:hypothetical protein Tco_1193112 [Tanacetum coccineum]
MGCSGGGVAVVFLSGWLVGMCGFGVFWAFSFCLFGGGLRCSVGVVLGVLGWVVWLGGRVIALWGGGVVGWGGLGVLMVGVWSGWGGGGGGREEGIGVFG